MLCKCGCGQITGVAKNTDRRWGHVKGEHVPYLKGHQRRGVHETNEERILRYSKPLSNGCIEWLGAKCRDGYAIFTPYGEKTRRLSRYIWEEVNGALSTGQFICHRCDNPSCINPSHFFVGSTQDNMDDMRQKGRQCRGENHPLTHLTEKGVRYIRQSTASDTALAEAFDLSRGAVSYIKSRATWKHVA